MKHRAIFNSGGCISAAGIESYLKGTLTSEERVAIKAHISSCCMCSDAIAGAGFFANSEEFIQGLQQLQHSGLRKSLNNPRPVQRTLVYSLTGLAAAILIAFGLFWIVDSGNSLKEKNVFGEKDKLSKVEQPAVNAPVNTSVTLEQPETEAGIKNDPQKKSTGRSVSPDKQERTVLILSADSIYANFEKTNASVVEDENKILVNDNQTAPEPEMEQEFTNMPAAAQSSGYFSDQVVNETAERNMLKSAIVSKKESYKKEAYNDDSFIEPRFRGGGIEYFKQYVTDSIQLFVTDSTKKQSVLVNFSIDKHGKVKRVKLIQPVSDASLNKRIIEIFEQAPNWTPAFKNGVAIEHEQQIELELGKK
jgi:hypothetical protein